ncbi:MAG: hypothetical protein ISS93_02495 [Candidatus Aenigmarchaeota archaeon]|nr:hypothetical protein [Candidatus Aenigmarchaeota archaeon]
MNISQTGNFLKEWGEMVSNISGIRQLKDRVESLGDYPIEGRVRRIAEVGKELSSYREALSLWKGLRSRYKDLGSDHDLYSLLNESGQEVREKRHSVRGLFRAYHKEVKQAAADIVKQFKKADSSEGRDAAGALYKEMKHLLGDGMRTNTRIENYVYLRESERVVDSMLSRAKRSYKSSVSKQNMKRAKVALKNVIRSYNDLGVSTPSSNEASNLLDEVSGMTKNFKHVSYFAAKLREDWKTLERFSGVSFPDDAVECAEIIASIDAQELEPGKYDSLEDFEIFSDSVRLYRQMASRLKNSLEKERNRLKGEISGAENRYCSLIEKGRINPAEKELGKYSTVCRVMGWSDTKTMENIAAYEQMLSDEKKIREVRGKLESAQEYVATLTDRIERNGLSEKIVKGIQNVRKFLEEVKIKKNIEKLYSSVEAELNNVVNAAALSLDEQLENGDPWGAINLYRTLGETEDMGCRVARAEAVAEQRAGCFSLPLYLSSMDVPDEYSCLRDSLLTNGKWEDRFASFSKKLASLDAVDKGFLKRIQEGIAIASNSGYLGSRVRSSTVLKDRVDSVLESLENAIGVGNVKT